MKDLTPQLTDALFKRIEKFEGVSLSEARASPSPTRSDCQHIQVFFTIDAKTFEGARDAASDLIDEMLAMGAEYRGHEIFRHKGYRAWCEFLFVMYEQEADVWRDIFDGAKERSNIFLEKTKDLDNA